MIIPLLLLKDVRKAHNKTTSHNAYPKKVQKLLCFIQTIPLIFDRNSLHFSSNLNHRGGYIESLLFPPSLVFNGVFFVGTEAVVDGGCLVNVNDYFCVVVVYCGRVGYGAACGIVTRSGT